MHAGYDAMLAQPTKNGDKQGHGEAGQESRQLFHCSHDFTAAMIPRPELLRWQSHATALALCMAANTHTQHSLCGLLM